MYLLRVTTRQEDELYMEGNTDLYDLPYWSFICTAQIQRAVTGLGNFQVPDYSLEALGSGLSFITVTLLRYTTSLGSNFCLFVFHL